MFVSKFAQTGQKKAPRIATRRFIVVSGLVSDGRANPFAETRSCALVATAAHFLFGLFCGGCLVSDLLLGTCGRARAHSGGQQEDQDSLRYHFSSLILFGNLPSTVSEAKVPRIVCEFIREYKWPGVRFEVDLTH